MSMLLNEEQGQLRESAREFLAERSPVALQRALRDRGEALGFEPALWREVIELGWTAAVFPEDCGGLDFGWKGLVSVFEYSGRTLAALPLLSSVVLGGGVLLGLGDEAQRNRFLPGIIDGGGRFALALEEGGRHDPLNTRATARRDGDDWVLDGEKWFVIDGVGAQQLLVLARSEGNPGEAQGLSLFIVDAALPGVGVTGMRMVDARNSARVSLAQVRVSKDALLGKAGDAWAALDNVLDRARACLAAEALGLVREAFERTVAYLKERVQFDVPIGSFQALQHRVARLYCEVELLESCVRAAFEAIDAGDPELPQLASLAKARASDLCAQVLNEAVQLHGGIGVTDEFDLGLFVKRARMIQQTMGDGAFHRERYARLRGF
ncbi:acyl-CoA dehydrogenase [Rhodanobacter glycinis]|uniref:Acyl-CoA dehydrogenase n=1 Tax=Rhodanobacter glycinis TaxID=582702 RepID=A0A5B9DZL4_9GAMM|nr:acyl-CoA dehydrogenase [Rhodanobacter glycinis]QEE23406.1 acyl-CoA dehydrogenase [Rhodanobacter glycinis]